MAPIDGTARLAATDLVPPRQFGAVEAGLYRSNYPTDENFRFLQTLGLRTAVNLTQERLVRSALAFFSEHGIRLLELGEAASGEMWRGVAGEELLKGALELALDASAYPLLLMSSSGNHGVGLVVGCLRRLQGWAMSATLDEYRSFAAPAARYLTEQAIEHFDLQLLDTPVVPPRWYAQLVEVRDAEAVWLVDERARHAAAGAPEPAYLAHYHGGFELLAADEAAAARYINESDDD